MKVNRARITLVGPGSAGKTCVANSFLNMEFKDTPSTQGIDDLGLMTTVHQAEAREGRWGEFREFERMFEGFFAQSYYDKSNRAPANAPGQDRRVNRVDAPSIPSDKEYLRKEIGEVKRRGTGLVVSIHDFGGQRVFDVIHSFFLGPNGMYVLVFNMEWMVSDLRDSCLDHLKSWVNALIVHSSVTDTYGKLKCASIALVGTHKDKVPDSETHQEISKELQKLLSRSGGSIARGSLLENESEGLCFFPVDCTKGQADPTMVNLMKAIETDILKADYVKVERPLNYFKVLDEMNERKKTVSYLSLEEVSEIANKYRVGSQDLIEEMLRFFRELGLIMWHEEPSLRNVVILDPIKFFVSPATNIVCQHKEDEQGTIHSNDVLREAERNYHDDFQVMKSTGVVSSELLQFILMEHIKREKQTGQQLNVRYEAIKRLMNKYDLIVPMFDDFGEDDLAVTTPKKYLVPSLLKSLNERGDLNPRKNTLFMWCSIDGSDKLVNELSEVSERGFLPPGLFQRVATRVLTETDATRGGQSYEFVYKDHVWFYIGRTTITLTALENHGCIRIEYEGEDVYGPLKLVEGIMAEVKSECFKELTVVTLAPFHPSGGRVPGLIGLDMLNKMENIFLFKGVSYKTKKIKAAYATLLHPNVSNKPFDVFISYRKGEPQAATVRFLYSRLSRTLLKEENNRPLRVYYDDVESKIGDDFADNFCSAFKELGVFLPLINDPVLQRLKEHDPKRTDYVLAEWIIALPTGCKILPIKLIKEKEIDEHLKELPEIVPEETANFVGEKLAKVKIPQPPIPRERTVKKIAKEFFRNKGIDWESNVCLLGCRDRIREILQGRSTREVLRLFNYKLVWWGPLIIGVMMGAYGIYFLKWCNPLLKHLKSTKNHS